MDKNGLIKALEGIREQTPDWEKRKDLYDTITKKNNVPQEVSAACYKEFLQNNI